MKETEFSGERMKKKSSRSISPLNVFVLKDTVYMVFKKKDGKLYYKTAKPGKKFSGKGQNINIKIVGKKKQIGKISGFIYLGNEVRKGEEGYLIKTILRGKEKTFLFSGKTINSITMRRDISSLPGELIFTSHFKHNGHFVGYFNDEGHISMAVVKDFKKVNYVRDVAGSDIVSYSPEVLPIVTSSFHSSAGIFVLLDLSFTSSVGTSIVLGGAIFEESNPGTLSPWRTSKPILKNILMEKKWLCWDLCFVETVSIYISTI